MNLSKLFPSIVKTIRLLLVCLFTISGLHAQKTTDTTDIRLSRWLESYSVSNELPIPRTLYFWKEQERLDSAIVHKKILDYGWGEDCSYDLAWFKYLNALGYRPIKNHYISSWLMEDSFHNLQAAWPCYWIDISEELDSVPRDYMCNADQLVKAELMDSSLIVVLRPDKSEFLFIMDLNGRKLKEDEIKRRKNHIAAVYYSEHKKGKSRYCKGAISDKSPCTGWRKLWHGRTSHYDYWVRTFFLVNENMIQKWTSGTAEIKDTIKSDLANMNQLKELLKKNELQYYALREEIIKAWDAVQVPLSIQELRLQMLHSDEEMSLRKLNENIEMLEFIQTVQKKNIEIFPTPNK